MLLRRTLLVIVGLVVCLAIWLSFATTGFPSALKPSRDEPSATRIDNVRLVSMIPGAPEALDNQSVLIVDGAIVASGDNGSLALPDGLKADDLRVIDGAGKTLLPGLIDAHVHVWDEAELAGYLAHGVTGVRNMSGMPFHLPLIKRIEEGRILGPDLVTTGPILNSPGANAQDNHIMVTTADEARAAVQRQFKEGYRTIKVYSNLYRKPFDAIVDEAGKLGMTIVGHTPEGVREEGVPYDKAFDIPFDYVLAQGFSTIEHTESIVWHGLRDDLDEEKMRVLAQSIAESGAVVDATLIAHDNLVRVAQSKGDYLKRPGTETLNPVIGMFEAGVYEFWSARDPSAYEVPHAAFYRKATKVMRDAGAPIIVGTDAGIFTNLPGSSLTRELELFVKAGFTPYEALAAATSVSGPAIGLPDRGQIAPGYRANLILVDGDPLSNVSVVENPAGVMVGGVWLDEKKLGELRAAAGKTSIPRSARRVIAALMSK
ncbi:MAG TPA: amidohydrolase family protein [Amphiplicatus sp.]|nr:amidohydrolase family protein [Amphiplicatus sp.]